MRSVRSRSALVCASLAASVLAAFWEVRGHAFVTLDDGEYVFANPHVARGLTWAGARWAFLSTEVQNWHPLTWLSHMADVQLFGLDAGAHHLVSVAFHAANAILLFLALDRATRAPWRSAVVASLFALHPLHVESVAWVAERKDVLSTFLGLLAILAYARWARRGGRWAYGASWLLAAASLLAKPMLVTLPLLLLLLDRWPLARLRLPGEAEGAAAGEGARSVTWRRAALEKVPFALLSLASAIVTFVAQQRGGAVVDHATLPLGARLANAAVAYATYAVKTAWPSGLGVYYPLPSAGHPAWKVAAASVAVAAATLLALRGSRRRPYLATGWLWFLVALVPVIGLVQVGGQAWADRYTYVPSIGLFVLLSWGGHDALAAFAPRRGVRLAALPIAAALAALGVLTRAQAAHWRDSRALFEHALAVAPDNWMAQTSLGKAAFAEGDLDEAVVRFREALALRPGSQVALTNLGTALARRGDVRGAERLFREAIASAPRYPNAWYNLGVALLDQGRAPEAVDALRAAADLAPGDLETRKALGAALLGAGQPDPAASAYREALRVAPDDVAATAGLGVALAERGDLDGAIEAFRRAVALDPGNAVLRENLETALAARAGPAAGR